MAYIYKITNKINNKIYIGETNRTIDIRWRQHKQRAKNINNKEYLYNAMRKYGIENFAIEEIEECPDEARFERETFYILKLNSMMPTGYNMTLSKEGASLKIKDDLEELWEKGYLIVEIAEKLNLNIKTIREYLYTIGITKEQTIERRNAHAGMHSRKPVRQYSIEGEFICDYESLSAAAKALNLNCASIGKACQGTMLTYKNFIWQYELNDNIELVLEKISKTKKVGTNSKRVAKLDLNKEILEIFPSCSEAGRSLNKAHTGISYAARNGTKAYGFYWKYL